MGIETVVEAKAEPEAVVVPKADETKLVRKHFVVEVKRINEADLQADVVISTGMLDRDKEIVDPEGMTLPKPTKIPLVAGHSYGDLTRQIGEVHDIVPGDKRITARPKWYAGEGNVQADWAWTLARKGVAAFSIGFLPIEVENADLGDEKVLESVRAGKTPMRRFKKWELVEVSQVIVPSNRQALQRLVDAGVIDKAQAEPIMAKAKDEPLSEDALKTLDAALAQFKSDNEPRVDVDLMAMLVAADQSSVDPKNPDVPTHDPDDVLGLLNQEPKAQHGGCPPGHHWNGTRCVKDEKGLGQDAPVADERIGVAGEVPATEPKPGPGPVADADRQKPGQPRSAWNLHGLTPEKLEEALSQFKANVAKQIKDATGEFESKVSEAVASAMAEHAAGQPQIAADSVAHLTAKELVGAIIPQVMDQVRREIARARGDVDFYVRPQE